MAEQRQCPIEPSLESMNWFGIPLPVEDKEQREQLQQLILDVFDISPQELGLVRPALREEWARERRRALGIVVDVMNKQIPDEGWQFALPEE